MKGKINTTTISLKVNESVKSLRNKISKITSENIANHNKRALKENGINPEVVDITPIAVTVNAKNKKIKDITYKVTLKSLNSKF